MEKDYNEILMGLNIREWCHTMGHETEDDIQDAYMIALDFIKSHPDKYPSGAHTIINRFFKQKYKDDITFVSLEEFLANNSEYKTLPPTEIENFINLDEILHYQNAAYRILEYLKKRNMLKDDSTMKHKFSEEEYRKILKYYCNGCSVIQYVLDNNIPLSRELICILFYYADNSEITLAQIAKAFNVSPCVIRIIIARGMRKIRRIAYFKVRILDSHNELFY